MLFLHRIMMKDQGKWMKILKFTGMKGGQFILKRLSWKNSFFNLFIYIFRLCWVFIATHRLSLVAASRGYSWLPCAGFSLQWLLFLWSTSASVVEACRLSCSTALNLCLCNGRQVLNHWTPREVLGREFCFQTQKFN